MDKTTLKARIVELAGTIQYHAELYHSKAKPEITDAEYDMLVDELKALVAELEQQDASAPEIAQGKEVLDNVGAAPSYGKKVKHNSIMGSLDKETTTLAVEEWYDKYAVSKGYIAVTPKIDGCSLRINYEDGKLVQAATRGDGAVGQDVTDNVLAMKDVPKYIGAGKTCEVRCEVYMKKSVFQNIAGTFANPRNAASGSLMAKDPNETAQRNLSILAYDVIIPNTRFADEGEKRAWMVANLDGIELVRMDIVPIGRFGSMALEWEAARPILDYEIDGLVIALDSIEAQEEAGWDGKRPRGKVAFKFKPEQKTARVIGINWQVGRLGRLTPMARIEPTLLAGSTIRNITLHNAANVKSLRLNIGDEVLIEKCGDVIPGIVRNLSNSD